MRGQGVSSGFLGWPVAIMCAVAALGSPVSTAASDWPQFRGPTRDGKAGDGPALLKAWPEGGPKQLWVSDGLGEGYSSAAIANGRIYVTGMEGNEGFLYALDLDGKQLWKTAYGKEWEGGHRGARTTPTVRDGRAYLMSGYGKAACYDAKTGAEIWAVDTMAVFGAVNLTWGITESPLVLEDRVILTPGGLKAGMVALDPKTGATIWVCSEFGDPSGYCSPILITRGGRNIIVQLTGATLVGLAADTGKLLWREVRAPVPAHKIQATTPVYADGRIYVTSGYGGERGQLYLLSEDGASVKSAWRESALDCHHGGLVLLDGLIYGAADGNNRNQWVCLRLETGEVVAKTGAVGKGSLAFADGMLYTLGEKGMMGLVNPDVNHFQMVSSFKIPGGGNGPHWAHPSIADGRLYIRHGARLFAYEIKAE